MSGVPSRKDFEAVVATAVTCRSCFADITVKSKVPGSPPVLITPALINIAQPRWVGPSYWASSPRIAIVMLNPGGGANRSDARDEHSPDKRALTLLQAFASGEASLSSVFEHQAQDMPKWGGGRFTSFYLSGLNLQLENIALANVAWCATSDNSYPSAMLKRCFDRHTGSLIRALAPSIVLLSGSGTHRFARHVADLVPAAKIICMFHYAHRESIESEEAELGRVRQLVSDAREVVTQQQVAADGLAWLGRG